GRRSVAVARVPDSSGASVQVSLEKHGGRHLVHTLAATTSPHTGVDHDLLGHTRGVTLVDWCHFQPGPVLEGGSQITRSGGRLALDTRLGPGQSDDDLFDFELLAQPGDLFD